MSSTSNMTMKKKRINKYTEEDIKKAIHEIQVNGKQVLLDVCRLYGIPRSTMNSRLRRLFKNRGAGPRLGVENEKKIKDLLLNRAKCGQSFKNQDVSLDAIQKIIKEAKMRNPFEDDRPGKYWYGNFLKRNPELTECTMERITKASDKPITEESVRIWFAKLENFLKDTDNKDILQEPERIFNVCEFGFHLSPGTGRILAPKGLDIVPKHRLSKDKNSVTVLVAFNANAHICPPQVVIPFLRTTKAILENMPVEWCFVMSENGLMESNIVFKYITYNLDKFVEHYPIKRPILLLCEQSNISQDLNNMCEILGFILYALPPGTDFLQPAELGIFGPLKLSWNEAVSSFLSKPENLNSTLNKTNFCQFFCDILENACKNDNIKEGFRKCGLYPFNPDAIDYTKCKLNNSENDPESSISRCQETTLEVLDFQIHENTIESSDDSNEFSDLANKSQKIQCKTDCVDIMDTLESLDNTLTSLQIEYTTCGPSIPLMKIYNKSSDILPSRTVDKNKVGKLISGSNIDKSVA